MRFYNLGCCVVMLACAGSRPVGPTVPLNEQFTLSPGETASITGSVLRVQFVQVSGDSRCPSDVVCIQAGDARVDIRVSDGNAPSDYELHTGDPARTSVTHGRLRVELIRLDPYPISTRVIPRNEYRATFRAAIP